MRLLVFAIVLLAIVLLPIHAQQVPFSELLPGMGPVAVAHDGSLQRISNWNELTPGEREAAHRALRKRNAKRLERLRAEERQKPVGRHARIEAKWLTAWIRPAKQWLRKLWMKRLPTLDFAPEFVDSILECRKQATTRLSTVEPKLLNLRPGSLVRATCVRCENGTRKSFATLNITNTAWTQFGSIDDDLAIIEGFSNASALQSALRGFYPALSTDTQLLILHWSTVYPSTCAEYAVRGALL